MSGFSDYTTLLPRKEDGEGVGSRWVLALLREY